MEKLDGKTGRQNWVLTEEKLQLFHVAFPSVFPSKTDGKLMGKLMGNWWEAGGNYTRIVCNYTQLHTNCV